MIFIDKKIFFGILNRVYSARAELDLSDETIRVEIYDDKNAENYRNCYVAKYRIVSKLLKLSIQILIAKNKDMNKGRVKILLLYLIYYRRYRPSKSVTVGTGRFIVLNDSASTNMVTKMYLNFFLKDLELFECR